MVIFNMEGKTPGKEENKTSLDKPVFPNEKEVYDGILDRDRELVEQILRRTPKYRLFPREREEIWTLKRKFIDQRNSLTPEQFKEFFERHFEMGKAVLYLTMGNPMSKQRKLITRIMSHTRFTKEKQGMPVEHRHAIKAIALLGFNEYEEGSGKILEPKPQAELNAKAKAGVLKRVAGWVHKWRVRRRQRFFKPRKP